MQHEADGEEVSVGLLDTLDAVFASADPDGLERGSHDSPPYDAENRSRIPQYRDVEVCGTVTRHGDSTGSAPLTPDRAGVPRRGREASRSSARPLSAGSAARVSTCRA